MATNSIRLSLLLFLVMFICSKAELGQLKETKMTMYFQDYSGGGPNATVIEVTGKPNEPPRFFKFGALFCTDDPITKDFKASSAQVARGQGLFMTSALDGSRTHVSISIVFTNEYKGSTLEIQGSSPQLERVREVAVVGGTGKFRMARGYATFETIYYNQTLSYSVLQCNVTVYHY